MHDRAVADEPGIQLVRQSIATEFLVKIPQHFGLGQGGRAIRGVRHGLEEILGQTEELFENTHQSVPVAVVDHDNGDPPASLVQSVSMVGGRWENGLGVI